MVNNKLLKINDLFNLLHEDERLRTIYGRHSIAIGPRARIAARVTSPQAARAVC